MENFEREDRLFSNIRSFLEPMVPSERLQAFGRSYREREILERSPEGRGCCIAIAFRRAVKRRPKGWLDHDESQSS
jgi:hypothetical protein